MTIRLGLLGAVALGFGAFFGAAPAMAQPIPSGSYQRSCDSISVYDGTLRARCQTEDGDRINTRLDDYNECDGDIGNADGRLTCTRDDGDDSSDNRVPQGSYRETCQNERVEGRDLVADCADRYGRERHSELRDYRQCRGDIANDNGALDCDRGDSADDGDALPGGTWRSTCRDERVSRNVLHAECRNRNGRWIDSSVDLRNCRLGVSNDNGRLVCVVAAVRNWRISLYKNIGYRGVGRTFIGDIPDLARYGLVNSVSSAYLRAGAWEVCTRTYYRGQCVVLRTSVSNFSRLGINDRIRSLRRVR